MLPDAVPGDEVVCHNDLLGGNVIFRRAAGRIHRLGARGAGPRGVDLRSAGRVLGAAASRRPDAARHGMPTDRRGKRLRLLLDAYGYEDRDGFLDLVAAVWRSWREAFRRWGGVERRERWAEAYDPGVASTSTATSHGSTSIEASSTLALKPLTILLTAAGSPGTAALAARCARTASATFGSSAPT